eukprot:1761814-Rhodomonas_salina.2
MRVLRDRSKNQVTCLLFWSRALVTCVGRHAAPLQLPALLAPLLPAALPTACSSPLTSSLTLPLASSRLSAAHAPQALPARAVTVGGEGA